MPRWEGERRAVLLDLAHEIDESRRVAALLAQAIIRDLGAHRDVGDHADQQRFAAADAEKSSDRGGGLVGGVGRRGRQPNARLGATDGNDAAQRLAG